MFLKNTYKYIYTDAMENVLVTNIVSPEKFHVQLAKHYRTIQDLHKKYKYLIEKLYVTGVNTPVIGKSMSINLKIYKYYNIIIPR